MATIFIGGSRHSATIPASIARRIDSIMERVHDVIVGDAPGADAAVQRYMQASSYRPVIVFCSGRQCRNNLGAWSTRQITPPADARGFQFYAAKDRAMAQSADFGLMLWDGRSIGTLANTMRLTQAGKATVLFDASRGQTFNIRTFEQWNDFAATISRALLDALNSRVASEGHR
jgi:adenine-specific DNA-methyltransferase